MPIVTWHTPGFRYSLPAGEDFSIPGFSGPIDYRAVIVNASGEAIRTVGNGGAIDGVIQNNPALGEACEIVAGGITKALLGPAFGGDPSLPVVRGDLMQVLAAGLFRKAQPGAVVVGRALTSASFG